MKELSIEEKAKRYDEAIKKAKSLYKASEPMSGCNVLLETVFTELKESEDERIRKELISFFTERAKYTEDSTFNGLSSKEIIAWLEKQGDPTEINPSEFESRLNKILKQFETLPKEELASSLSFYLNVVQNDGSYKEEKQGEQKPTDKVDKEAMYDRPKWNVSDFRTWQYIVSDVLTKKDGIGQYLDNGECKKIAKYMQEEWSKKLNIEQKHAELLKGEDYGIDGLYHAINILERTLGNVNGYQSDDGILEHKCAISAVKRLYEQKPAWSEEDERQCNNIISLVEGKAIMRKDIKGFVNWLKSLKDRYAWKPSEEQMEVIEAVINNRSFQRRHLDSLYEQLKKLTK